MSVPQAYICRYKIIGQALIILWRRRTKNIWRLILKVRRHTLDVSPLIKLAFTDINDAPAHLPVHPRFVLFINPQHAGQLISQALQRRLRNLKFPVKLINCHIPPFLQNITDDLNGSDLLYVLQMNKTSRPAFTINPVNQAQPLVLTATLQPLNLFLPHP
jgi:hypothetical protein